MSRYMVAMDATVGGLFLMRAPTHALGTPVQSRGLVGMWKPMIIP